MTALGAAVTDQEGMSLGAEMTFDPPAETEPSTSSPAPPAVINPAASASHLQVTVNQTAESDPETAAGNPSCREFIPMKQSHYQCQTMQVESAKLGMCVLYRRTSNTLVGWLGFNGILSTQVAAISCLRKTSNTICTIKLLGKSGVCIIHRSRYIL